MNDFLVFLNSTYITMIIYILFILKSYILLLIAIYILYNHSKHSRPCGLFIVMD